MNTKFKINHTLVVALVLGITVFSSCSKDRIETPELTSYESMNEYFDSQKQEEQEFVIDTLGECPIIGKLGTKICLDKNKLVLANGDSVFYPYTLKLVELYTPKDLLYYQALSNSKTGVFSTKSAVRIRAAKNDSELALRSDGVIEVEMKDSVATNSQSVYVEETTNPFVWQKNDEEFTKTDYGYIAMINELGWNAAGKDIVYNQTVKLSFTSQTDNLETVRIFVYLPAHESLLEAVNQNIMIPVGEEISVIIMAIDGSKQLYHFYTKASYTSDSNIAVTMAKISSTELTAILDSL